MTGASGARLAVSTTGHPATEGRSEATNQASAGTVRALLLGPITGGPMERRTELMLLSGRGIEGDRYAIRAGTFSRSRKSQGLAVTLIEEEAIAAACKQHGVEVDFETTRRNIVTSGIRLESLVGKEFQVGSAVVRGIALNPPCSRLEKLSSIAGLKSILRGRGGIRADVVESGVVKLGDPLTAPPQRSGSTAAG